MDSFNLSRDALAQLLLPHQTDPFVHITLSKEQAEALPDLIGRGVRLCYISDGRLATRVADGAPCDEVIAARLPPTGATMSGDFGEILGYLYHCVVAPDGAIGIKKWRLKQDRTKPAPKSDVVHLCFEADTPSPQDRVLCSEVKAKATDGKSTPISAAIADCAKDRTSRLASTLVWLRERALADGLEEVTPAQLDRFIKSDEHGPYEKDFRAVAVISQELVAAELSQAPTTAPTEYTLVVIGVPNLKSTYESTFEGAHRAGLDE